MRNLLLLIIFYLIQAGFVLGQLETRSTLPTGMENTFNPGKKDIKAYSYRTGHSDLCTIAPVYEGVIYRVQFTVLEGFYNDFSQFVAERAVGDVYPEYVLNKNLTRYLVGDFANMAEARNALDRLVHIGHPHAFIVRYADGQRID